MLSLFKKYADAGKITEAVMIGQNMINNNPRNKEAFESYFPFLCNLAEVLPSLDDRMQFYDQANTVLSFYIENAELNEEIIEEVVIHQKRLEEIRADIHAIQEARIKAEEEENRKTNDKHLKKLYKLKDELFNTKTKEAFDETLKKIRNTDLLIDKTALTEKQNDAYDELIKENTEIMSEKMRELERKERKEYNMKAAEAFREAFTAFQGNEDKYKNQTQLFTLASNTLFAYDAAKLFNETLIYYNHVYSYIFSKLDDDGKLALTKYSIMCERSMR